MTESEAKAHAPRAKKKAKANADADVAVKARRDRRREAKERRDERVRQVAMTEARARIAAIDAGHRAAVEILSRLGFFPDESPSLGAKPASRTAAVTGDIDYGDDDDLEESAREDHVEPKDDRPRVHASLVRASLSAALIDALSAALVDDLGARGARRCGEVLRRGFGGGEDGGGEPTEAADAAALADSKTASSIWRGKQAMRWATPRGSHRERRPRDVVHRRGDARRASRLAPGPAPGPARGPAPDAPALGAGRRARGRWRALPPAKAAMATRRRVRQVAMTEARARIAAIDAGHRAASRPPSARNPRPGRRDRLRRRRRESARENHVEVLRSAPR